MKNKQRTAICYPVLANGLLGIIAGIFLLLQGVPAKAQFLGGFFSQQSQKKKLMAEQITGINIYLNAVKKGYGIMHGGIETSRALKNGSFQLHDGYYNSLEQVAPVIQQNPKAQSIAVLQQQLIKGFDREISWQIKQGLLKPDEMNYLQKVAENLKKTSAADIAELRDVLTPGKMQLTDEERLVRVDKLYTEMKDKAAFSASFTDKCRQLAVSRQQARSQQEQVRKLYGIH